MGFILYVAFGLVLGYLTKVENDRPAISAGLEYVALFALVWPLILLYFIHIVMKRGVLKYKGKVIWTARKGN